MSPPDRLRIPVAPRTRSALEQLVGRYSRHYEIPQGRIRNWISFMVLGGALERLKDAEGAPAFVVKGGVALELRLKLRARATKDFDATFRERMGDMLAALDRALAEPYGDFQLARRGGVRDLGAKAKRLQVRLQYRGRPWSTVQVEVSAGDGAGVEWERVPAADLAELGLAGPDFIDCLSARFQIAQKIHAVSAPPPGARTNDRYRDLADLWLLRELGIGLRQVRDACEEVFRRRALHAWPPEIDVPGHWAEPFARLAEDVKLPVRDVGEVARSIQEYIREIALAE